MNSVGCILGTPSVCLCPSAESSSGIFNSSLDAVSSRRRFVTGGLRLPGRTANLVGKSLRHPGFERWHSFKSVGDTALRAGRAEPTFNAEPTEKNSGAKSSQESIAGPSAQTSLDLLQRFRSESSSSTGGKTIAQQLEGQVDLDETEEVTVPLAQTANLDAAPLTTSQKRNIRRQNYLNEVSKRNDAPFFTAVGLFVLVPPAVILGVAVATGYVDLFP